MASRSIAVLILDDEVEFRNLLADYLADEGCFEVHTAGTAPEAQAILDATAIDVCLADLRLRGGDGFVFAEEARARHPAVRFLIHTGSSLGDVRERARASGFPQDRILLKPLTLAAIVRAIQEAAGR
ncbi:MAG TPA: response regulator [Vicinamibacteria bacterium]|nr:response regulator [Vicinamibacteria bacterium]